MRYVCQQQTPAFPVEGILRVQVRGLLKIIAVAAAILGATAAISVNAGAERVQFGKLVLVVGGGFKPEVLPKHRFAPITLSGSGDISTVDGSLPPAPSQVDIDWDRNGRLTTRGLPVCQPSKLEATTTAAARAACGRALVGHGFASGTVQFPDDPPFNASSVVLAFNGPRMGGNPSIILHAYAFVPAPTTFVVPVIVRRIHQGRYGYNSFLQAPPIAGGYGVITHFDLKLHRTYRFKGRKLSQISARCADGRLQARGTVSFVDGTTLTGTVFRPCRARG
jgi:hypothetical protein